MFENAVNGYVSYMTSGYKEITLPDSAIDQILTGAQHLVHELKSASVGVQKSPLPALKP